ncbi:MAG: hypothetical protein ACRD18_10995, partial [Terriglobia bacterium]
MLADVGCKLKKTISYQEVSRFPAGSPGPLARRKYFDGIQENRTAFWAGCRNFHNDNAVEQSPLHSVPMRSKHNLEQFDGAA